MSWKIFEAFPNYEVSHKGQIRSLKTGKLIKGALNEAGYRRTCLYRNGESKSFYVHRIVAFLFIPNPNNYDEVHHINGNRDDNRSCNLMWVTHEQNMQFIYKPHKPNYKFKNTQPVLKLEYA